MSAVFSVDGDWGDWSSWSQCSATCGEGKQSRSRQCDNPPPSGNGATCSGDEMDTKICNQLECSGIRQQPKLIRRVNYLVLCRYIHQQTFMCVLFGCNYNVHAHVCLHHRLICHCYISSCIFSSIFIFYPHKLYTFLSTCINTDYFVQ